MCGSLHRGQGYVIHCRKMQFITDDHRAILLRVIFIVYYIHTMATSHPSNHAIVPRQAIDILASCQVLVLGYRGRIPLCPWQACAGNHYPAALALEK